MNSDKYFKTTMKWIKKKVPSINMFIISHGWEDYNKISNDMIVMREIFWEVKPDLVIETGIARGGSIIYSASLLKMMGISVLKLLV